MKRKKHLRLATAADRVITYFLLLIVAFIFFFSLPVADSGILFRIRFDLRV